MFSDDVRYIGGTFLGVAAVGGTVATFSSRASKMLLWVVGALALTIIIYKFLPRLAEPGGRLSARLPRVVPVGGDRKRRRMRILTMNMFVRPHGLSSDDVGDAKTARILQVSADHFLDYDLLLLQEVFDQALTHKARLIRNAHQAGFLHIASSDPPPLLSSAMTDAGLVILSKVPIVERRFRKYSRCAGSDCVAAKGVLHIRLADGTHVFNTHLQSAEGAEATGVRVAQLEELQQFMEDGIGNDAASRVLLGGDFNIDVHGAHVGHDDAARLQRLQKIMGLMATAARAPTATQHTDGLIDSRRMDCTVDYLFVRPARTDVIAHSAVRTFACTSAPHGRCSDHDGVECTLQLIHL